MGAGGAYSSQLDSFVVEPRRSCCHRARGTAAGNGRCWRVACDGMRSGCLPDAATPMPTARTIGTVMGPKVITVLRKSVKILMMLTWMVLMLSLTPMMMVMLMLMLVVMMMMEMIMMMMTMMIRIPFRAWIRGRALCNLKREATPSVVSPGRAMQVAN